MNIKTKLQQLGVESSMLDSIVDDAASRLATNANNDGLSSQLDFLERTCCWSDEQILEALVDEGIVEPSSSEECNNESTD